MSIVRFYWSSSVVSTVLFIISCLIAFWLFIGTALALTEAHKFFYTEEVEVHSVIKNTSDELRNQFINNLRPPTASPPEAHVEVPTESLAEVISEHTPEGENS